MNANGLGTVQKIFASAAPYGARHDEDDARDHASPRPIDSIGAADIFAPLEPFPWLIEGLQIGPGRMTLLAGNPDVGKTVIAQSIALSVASGASVFGVFSTDAGRVIHFDGEIGPWLARARYQRLARAMSVDVERLVRADALRLACYPDFTLDNGDVEARLIEACDGCKLAIVDSLTAFSGGIDENSKEVGRALYILARVSEATGVTFLVLHHTKKKPDDDKTGGAKVNVRGSGSIVGAAGTCFVVETTGKDAPSVVKHERALLGRKLDDFGIRIEDVSADGDPRWGLRVVHLEPEQLAQLGERAEAEAEQRELARAEARIRAFFGALRGEPFRGSRDDLRTEVGIGARPFKRALRKLIADGALERGGTYHEPSLRWVGGRPC